MLNLFYGGTFDPVHNGHLAIARAARDELQCPVNLMPAADPPHRPPPGADAVQRAQMLDLAVAGESGLQVDRRELQRAARDPSSRSYSVDTLRALRVERGTAVAVALLVGADSFVGLPGWRQWRELFELAHFVVADRPGVPLEGVLPAPLAEWASARWVEDPQALETAPAGRILRLRQPLQPESASDIRHRIASGQPWRGLVPAAVANYIAAKGLYFTTGADLVSV
jgi:nicotinate-nucleotide adenylyltransferase